MDGSLRNEPLNSGNTVNSGDIHTVFQQGRRVSNPIDLLGPELYTYWQDEMEDEAVTRTKQGELHGECFALQCDAMKLAVRGRKQVDKYPSKSRRRSGSLKRSPSVNKGNRHRRLSTVPSVPYPEGRKCATRVVNRVVNRPPGSSPARLRRRCRSASVARTASADGLKPSIFRVSPINRASACHSTESLVDQQVATRKLSVSLRRSRRLVDSLPPPCPHLHRTRSHSKLTDRAAICNSHADIGTSLPHWMKDNQSDCEDVQQHSMFKQTLKSMKDVGIKARAVDKARAKFMGTLARAKHVMKVTDNTLHLSTQSISSGSSGGLASSQEDMPSGWMGTVEPFPYGSNFDTDCNKLVVPSLNFPVTTPLNNMPGENPSLMGTSQVAKEESKSLCAEPLPKSKLRLQKSFRSYLERHSRPSEQSFRIARKDRKTLELQISAPGEIASWRPAAKEEEQRTSGQRFGEIRSFMQNKIT